MCAREPSSRSRSHAVRRRGGVLQQYTLQSLPPLKWRQSTPIAASPLLSSPLLSSLRVYRPSVRLPVPLPLPPSSCLSFPPRHRTAAATAILLIVSRSYLSTTRRTSERANQRTPSGGLVAAVAVGRGRAVVVHVLFENKREQRSFVRFVVPMTSWFIPASAAQPPRSRSHSSRLSSFRK